jgi:hypothetical protein
VSLFLRNAEAWQKVDNGLCFDFELAGQLVNSNLIGVGHALCLDHLIPKNLFRYVFLFRNSCVLRQPVQTHWLAQQPLRAAIA